MITKNGRERNIKGFRWHWFADTKELGLYNKRLKEYFIIDKIRACSLMRFLITVLQHPNTKKRVKNEKEK